MTFAISFRKEAIARSVMIRWQTRSERREMMAKRDLGTVFKSMLLQFVREADPLLSMLEWITQQLMQVEAEMRVGVEKGRHSTER